MTVRLEGFRELEQALNELPKSTGKNVLRRVAKGALQPMAEKAKSLTPRDKGDLAESIMVTEKRTRRAKGKSKTQFVGIVNGKRTFRSAGSTGIEMAMGPVSGKGVLNYATFAEFGTSDTRAVPYMRPAWYGGKDDALQYVKANLGLEIDKAAKRLAKKAARAK